MFGLKIELDQIGLNFEQYTWILYENKAKISDRCIEIILLEIILKKKTRVRF